MNKVELCNELSENFLGYAEAVNSDRAIPDAKSGLKPVARRILWMMYDNGFTSNKPHKKCAKTVGEVMGRVHPHGDSSIYEAMVRLSQPWVLRYPLLDFHGNNGNIAGDGAAAPRYTEARLSKISESGMLDGLKKKIVDFQLNYSEDEEEPITLPSLMPNLLINPNKGIGVSLACSWLPHNLTEVCEAILKTIKGEVITSLPGPDFPTGGMIINKDELASAYKTGKGRAIVRGKYRIEERNKKKLIVFYEIPYDVRTEKLLDQINEFCTKEHIDEINEIRDESGKSGLRIVIEVEKDADEVKILSKLFKSTDLQKTCSFNQVALINKKPTLLSLKECIEVYINHQIDIIKREMTFDLEKAKARLHIVEGLLIALEDIDNVISLIKKSENAAAAKTSLMDKYNLSETQAKAILDMKLSKLAKLEKLELEQEKKELIDTIADIEDILSKESRQKEILYNRLDAFKNKFGDNRRTELCNITISKEEKEVELIESKDVVVVLTKTGMVKKIPKTSFRVQKRNGSGVKTQEDVVLNTIKTNTIDYLLVFTTAGKMYRVLVDDIPDGTNVSKGLDIRNLLPKVESNEKVVLALSLERDTENKYIVFATKQGMIKKSALSEYKDFKKKMGIVALKLKEGDSIADIILANNENVVVTTHKGMGINFSLTEVTPTSRVTVGVKSISLGANDFVTSINLISPTTTHIGVFYQDGLGKKINIKELSSQKRGGKGIAITKDKEVVGTIPLTKNDNVLICSSQKGICISEEEIPEFGRTAIGNTLLKNGNVVSIAKV